MWGWIPEGIGILYLALCLIIERPVDLRTAGIAIGRRFKVLPLFRARDRTKQLAEQVFPEKEERERAEAYRCLKLGILFTALVLCGGMLLTVMTFEKEENFAGLRLPRPAYGEEDTEVRYKVKAEKDGQSLQQTVRIPVPSQKPSARQIDAMLSETEQRLTGIFREYDGASGRIELPERDGEVLLSYQSLNPDYVDSMGTVRWDNITKEVTARFRITMSAWEVSRDMEAELTLSPVQKSFREQVTDTLSGLGDEPYLKEKELLLPTEDESEIAYTWSAADSGPSVGTVFFLLILMPFLILYLWEQRQKGKRKRRTERILRRYPEMLNKMMILMGAGLGLSGAWERIVSDYLMQKERYRMEEPLYEEMYRIGRQLKNGYSMGEAITLFAERVEVKELRRFCNVLQLGWRRGDSHILVHLRELYDRSWEEHKQTVRRLSEEADTKLLFPLMLMLAVVMIIVLAPAMMTMTL